MKVLEKLSIKITKPEFEGNFSNDTMLKHISLILGILFNLFMFLLIFSKESLNYQIIANFKLINLFFLVIFLISMLVTILFSLKIKRENNYYQKKANFGLYLFFTGLIILNALLLVTSLNEYLELDLVNLYFLLILGIAFVILGLYLNYTYWDENIFFWIINNKNYSIRLILTFLTLITFILFNYKYPLFYFLLMIIFWLDLLLINFIIPLFTKLLVGIYWIFRFITIFLIALPHLIVNFIITVFQDLKRRSQTTFTRTQKLNLKLHFSKINFISIIFLAFGFSILFNQEKVYLFILLSVQLVLMIIPIVYLNKLFDGTELKILGKLKRRNFYELFITYLIILVYFFETLLFCFSLIIKIDFITLIPLAIYSLCIGIFFYLWNPLKLLFKYTIILFRKFLYETNLLLKSDPITSTKILLTSIGLTIVIFQLQEVVLRYLFSWIFVSDLGPTLKHLYLATILSIAFFLVLLDLYLENSSDIQKRLQIHFFIRSFSALFLISFIFYVMNNNYPKSPYIILIGLVLTILPNYLLIIKVSKPILATISQKLKNSLIYLKFETLDKFVFLYKTSITYKILTPVHIIRAGVNIFLLSLSLFILTHSISSNVSFIFVFYILFILFLIAGYQTLYTKYSIILEQSSQDQQGHEILSFIDKIKNQLFNKPEKNENQTFESLKGFKVKIILLFGVLFIPTAHIFDILFNRFLVTYPFITTFVISLSLLILNINSIIKLLNVTAYIFARILRNIILTIFNIIKAIKIFIHTTLNILAIMIINFISNIYRVLFKKGKISFTIDYTLSLIFIFILLFVSIPESSNTQFSLILFLGLLYISGLVIIWNELVIFKTKALIRMIQNTIIQISLSFYSIIVKYGNYSLSIDLFAIIVIATLASDYLLGYDFNRTLLFIIIFLIGLVIIWRESISLMMVKISSKVTLILQKSVKVFIISFRKLTITIQYVFKELINWLLFYISILFSIIFILYGLIFSISGILNDGGEFFASLFFDINLLFGLAKITNIILLLLGIAFIFAGLLLIRIINENKEKLFLHVFEIPKRTINYEVSQQ